MIAVRRRPRITAARLPGLIAVLVAAIVSAVVVPLGLANARPYEITAGGGLAQTVDSGDTWSVTMLTVDEAVWEEIRGTSVLRVRVRADCRWGQFSAGSWTFGAEVPGRPLVLPADDGADSWPRSLLFGGQQMSRWISFDVPRRTTRLVATDSTGLARVRLVIPSRRHHQTLAPTTDAAPLLSAVGDQTPLTGPDAAGRLGLSDYQWRPEGAFPGVQVRLTFSGTNDEVLPSPSWFGVVTDTSVYQRPDNTRFAFSADQITATMDFTIGTGGGLITVTDGTSPQARILIPAA